jgi:hypothetical protein
VDWIERLFGISPDGGDGYFEWVIVLFVAFLVAAAVLRRVIGPRRPKVRRIFREERPE